MTSTTEGVNDPNRSQRWNPEADQWEEGFTQLLRCRNESGNSLFYSRVWLPVRERPAVIVAAR